MEVTPILKDDIHDLMENTLEVVLPFMKLSWKDLRDLPQAMYVKLTMGGSPFLRLHS